ncbi:MAG: LCP family protein [Candidatus Pacebacteria bacterium]|nr:LCP family protein [Candidatus Paceibacterota bacterium]
MKKSFKILKLVILAIILLCLIIFCFKYNKEVKIFSSISKIVNLQRETPDKNILLLGMAGQETNGGLLTDAIMVANINFDDSKINLISIPRDLLVQDPKTNQFFKLNYVYFNENVYNQDFNNTKNIKIKAEQIIGLEISNTVVVDLDGFRYFIDSLGGIDIVLSEAVYDPNLKNPLDPTKPFYLPKGDNHLDGKTAAKFIRTRYVQDGDITRGSHQQLLLQAVFDKVKQDLSLPNLMKIYNS